MKRYAVAQIDFFENSLNIKFTKANTWKEALNNCFPLNEFELPDDIESAKFEAFNGDFQFDVKELPGEILP